MAWEHFTTLLNPGQVVTADQRNELLDALDERIQAAGNSGDGLHGDMSAVRSSPIITDLVKYTWLGTLRTERIWSVLGRICTRYVVSDTSRTHYNSSTFTVAVEALVGGSFSAVFGTMLSAVRLWNATRQGISLLSIIEPAQTSVSTIFSKVGTDQHWADAKAEFLAYSESSATPIGAVLRTLIRGEERGTESVPAYVVQGARCRLPINLPAVPALASWSWWLIGDIVSIGDVWVDFDYILTAGANVGVGTLTPPPGYPSGPAWNINIKLGPFVGGGTGAMNIGVEPLAYANSAALSVYEPPPGDERRMWWETDNRAFIAPTFTHPDAAV